MPQIIERPKRHFMPEEFNLTTIDNLLPYYQQLLESPTDTVEHVVTLLRNRSELDSILEEETGWRYIKMTCDTTNLEARQQYLYVVENVEPQLAELSNQLDNKIFSAPAFNLLDSKMFSGLGIYKRNLIKEIAIFKPENIENITAMRIAEQQYGTIAGAMSITHNGDILTLQQAGSLLQSQDRKLRETMYMAIQSRRSQDYDVLDTLLSNLVATRHKIGQIAGFEGYTEYYFKASGRFDFSVKDCLDFHKAVDVAVVPLLNSFSEDRAAKLGLELLRPYDFNVDPDNAPPLVPFNGDEDLYQKTLSCVTKVDPEFGNMLQTMKAMGRFDLGSRQGKAPGGYNYPLDEIGVPFIFMNAAGTLSDAVTMLHEAGHAFHSLYTRSLPLQFFKHTTSEVAEVASMSMELLSMSYWDVFFDNAADLKRAKIQHLKQVIETLPWVACIDKYQHWLYANPTHTIKQRDEAWVKIYQTFSAKNTDWEGLEAFRAHLWQKQLHIYEVPFYYIEYGFAQLGAIAIWRNYLTDKVKGVAGYKAFLKLGYTKTVPEIFEAAGIKFSFSESYIKELMVFVKEQIDAIMSA